jgi:hypothetical protein
MAASTVGNPTDRFVKGTVTNVGSLQMTCCKLQQCRKCKSELQENHYKLYLEYPRYDLYRRITATSTFMLRRPRATISYSKNITSYHKGNGHMGLKVGQLLAAASALCHPFSHCLLLCPSCGPRRHPVSNFCSKILLLTSDWPRYHNHLDILFADLRIHPSGPAPSCAPPLISTLTSFACLLMTLALWPASGYRSHCPRLLFVGYHGSHGAFPVLCAPYSFPPATYTYAPETKT